MPTACDSCALEPAVVHFDAVFLVLRCVCETIIVPNVLVRPAAEGRRAFEDGFE